MRLKAMVTVFCLLTVAMMAVCITYSLFTKEPDAAMWSALLGIPVAAACVGINSELE